MASTPGSVLPAGAVPRTAISPRRWGRRPTATSRPGVRSGTPVCGSRGSSAGQSAATMASRLPAGTVMAFSPVSDSL